MRYLKFDLGDYEIEFEWRIEDTIRREIQAKGPRQITVIGFEDDGPKSFSLPSVPESEIDRVMEWMNEIELTKISQVAISHPNARIDFGVGEPEEVL